MKNLLTKEAFAEWVGKQPADTPYSYSNFKGACAFGQYLAFIGLPVKVCAINVWIDTEERDHLLPEWVDRAVIGDGYTAYQSHTFGALAARLRAEA